MRVSENRDAHSPDAARLVAFPPLCRRQPLTLHTGTPTSCLDSRVMDHRSNVDRGGSRMLPHPNLSNTHRVRIHTSNNQNGGFQLLYVTNTERFISHYCVHGSMTAGVYRQAVIFG